MIDGWIGDILVVLVVLLYPLWMTFRRLPRLQPGSGIRLEEPALLQERYEKRYRRLFFPLRVLPALLAAFFGLRVLFMSESERAEGPTWTAFLITIGVAFIAALILASVAR